MSYNLFKTSKTIKCLQKILKLEFNFFESNINFHNKKLGVQKTMFSKFW